MAHILDNPIWNALDTGNKTWAHGTAHAKYMKRDVGIFAGLQNNDGSDLVDLHAQLPEKSFVILFTLGEIDVPQGWRIETKEPLLQMVYAQQNLPDLESKELIALQENHIPAMLDLTALTHPGPFFSRTIDLGTYEGVFDGNNLVAMAGQRLQPDPYTEVSAVCTHPLHTGKGHAAKLIRSQVRKILEAGRIPFLHVLPENPACRLYEKLGFEIRKQMVVTVLERE